MSHRVIDISLVDVMCKYLNRVPRDFDRDGKSNRYKTICPFHKDTDPSLVLYDKTESGEGWDYHCFPCGNHGTAPNMLVSLGIAKNEDDAIAMLMKDFGLELPDKVQLEDFSKFKGLDLDFLVKNGVEDVKDGVKIPFYDVNGKVIANKIRVKYSGKGKYYWEKSEDDTKNPPYGLHFLNGYDKSLPLYITEGETDGFTVLQSGFQALGIAGANAFKPEIAELISDFEQIVIIKDNDDAGQRLVDDIAEFFADKLYILKLPNGIKDINNFHLYRCASKIDKFKSKFLELRTFPATIQCFIETSKTSKIYKDPDAWTIISKQLDNPMEQAEFINEFCKATKFGRREVKAMLDAASFESTIRGRRLSTEFFEDDNSYFKAVVLNGVPTEKQVSNFVIRPLFNKVTEEGDIRIVKLINKYGEETTVELTPEELSNCAQFDTKVKSIGRNNFYGNNEDLKTVCDIIFDSCTKRVESPLAIGHVSSNHWVFGNCGIGVDRNVVVRNTDGIVKLGENNYMPRSISVNDDGTVDNYMPTFDLEKEPLTDSELEELMRTFKNNIGSYNAWLGLGWAVANWYSDAVFKKFGFYPFLFIVGKRGQGKTTFASLLNQVFGYNKDYSGRNFDNSTPASMSRALNYSCSLPIWYDDYKDNGATDVDSKTQMLLGAYNRQGGDRANRFGTGLDIRSVRSTLLISGEYSPSNSALKSRCVTLIINNQNRNNTLYNQVARLFSRIPLNALGWASDSLTKGDEFISLVESHIEALESVGLMERTARNLAVFLAGFDMVFKKYLSDAEYNEFISWTTAITQGSEKITKEAHHLVQFFNDLGSMLSSSTSEFDYGRDVVYNGNEIRLKKTDTYRLWQQFQPNRRLLVNEDTLKSDLANEKYHIGRSESKCSFTTGQARCWVFDYEQMKSEGIYDDFLDTLKEVASKQPEY